MAEVEPDLGILLFILISGLVISGLSVSFIDMMRPCMFWAGRYRLLCLRAEPGTPKTVSKLRRKELSFVDGCEH